MSEVNSELTKSQRNASNGVIPDVDIRKLKCDKSFIISNMTNKDVIGSIQGYDIDENAQNIYISSELKPSNGERSTRKIVKIPWNNINSDDWDYVELDDNSTFEDDIPTGKNYLTEFEGIQYISNNEVYLTVAYHDPSQEGDLTVMNRIYRVTW